MATIRELIVKLGVDADVAGLKKFDDGLGMVKAGMQAVAAVGAVVVATIGAIAYTTATAGDQAAKGAQRTATQVEEYQKLAYAAGTAGVSIEQFEASLKLSNKTLQEVSKGNEAVIKKLNGLGLDIDGTESQAELMYEVADAIAATEDPQKRLAIATAVYGDEVGARMVPLLAQGSKGIKELGLEAEALGMVMGEQTAKESEAFLDNLGRITGIAAGLRNEIGGALLPVLNELITSFVTFYKEHKPEILDAVQSIGAVIGDVVRVVGDAALWVAKAIESTVGFRAALVALAVAVTAVGTAIAAGGLLVALGGVVSMVSSAIPVLTSLGTVAAGFAATLGPVGTAAAVVAGGIASLAFYFWPLIAAVTTAGLVIDDLLTYFRGGNSAIGEFIARNAEADGVVGALARTLQAVVEILRAVYSIAGMVGTIIVDRIGGAGSGAVARLMAAIRPLADWLANTLGPIADKVLGRIAAGLDKVTAILGPLAGDLDAMAPEAAAATGQALDSVGLEATAQAAPTGTSAEFAPTPPAPSGSAASPMAPVVNTGGNTYTLNGIGTHDEVRELIRQETERANRNAAAALGAGER